MDKLITDFNKYSDLLGHVTDHARFSGSSPRHPPVTEELSLLARHLEPASLAGPLSAADQGTNEDLPREPTVWKMEATENHVQDRVTLYVTRLNRLTIIINYGKFN